MYGTGKLALVLAGILGIGACADAPVSPSTALHPSSTALAQKSNGTGLVLNDLTGVTLPLIGEVGTVDIQQANLTHLAIVQDVVGNIIGVQAEGALQLTGGVLGTKVVTQNFLTQVDVASSGNGQCDVLTVDLGPVALDALGKGVSVDVPRAAVTPRASGALGSLLCNLGQALQGPVGSATGAVRGLVNAINNLLI